MSDRNAPIDEKWLDKPRAKRSLDGSSIGSPKKRRNLQSQHESLRESENSRQTGNSATTKDEDTKKASTTSKEVHQTSISSFFSSSAAKKKKQPKQNSHDKISLREDKETKNATKNLKSEEKALVLGQNPKKTAQPEKDLSPEVSSDTIPKPMIPSETRTPGNATWRSSNENIIYRKVPGEAPRGKVAAMDLDGTLMVWRIDGWPSRLEHYELWSSTIPAQLRSLHDEGYKLVIFTNQGAIRKAHTGKKAILVQNVINWIAKLVGRPIHAVMSTKSPKADKHNSHHKPSEKMWGVAIKRLNNGVPFDVSKSFFVGDSADLNDAQGGVDFQFAVNVTKVYGEGSKLQFYEPSQKFGLSDTSRRDAAKAVGKSIAPPPKQALTARAALLGGYYPKVPIMLLLCGVQGSGKSTFCEQLLGVNAENWVHLSQDTINKGKPGKREQVEERARAAIEDGKCCVIDRTHLDPMQRQYFIDVAKSVNAPVHVAVFSPPKNVILDRVRQRKNHAGKVEGESGVRIASAALQKLQLPSYKEEIELITKVSTPQKVEWLASLYGNMMKDGSMSFLSHHEIGDKLKLPTLSLGTMGMGKRKAKDIVLSMINAGFDCVDTSITYKNLEEVGTAFSSATKDVVCIVKIPKAVSTPEQVRPSLDSQLGKLELQKVDLLLLHWPCDVMAADVLSAVWKEMECCVKEGLCKALGVCNFNVGALASLLTTCTIRPAVNQVELHPLFQDWPLIDFCSQQDILIQAHSPLGQGKDELLKNSVLQKIASETSMSTAQVVIRWNLQHGVLVAPKCSSLDHANAILQTRPLSPDQMKAIDSLDKGRRFVNPPFMYGKAVYCWGERFKR